MLTASRFVNKTVGFKVCINLTCFTAPTISAIFFLLFSYWKRFQQLADKWAMMKETKKQASSTPSRSAGLIELAQNPVRNYEIFFFLFLALPPFLRFFCSWSAELYIRSEIFYTLLKTCEERNSTCRELYDAMFKSYWWKDRSVTETCLRFKHIAQIPTNQLRTKRSEDV